MNTKVNLKLRVCISFAISILVLCYGLSFGASDPEEPFLTSLRTRGFRLIPATERIPVILDTDIGTDIDDAFALALALSSPEIELRGVTTVSADAYTRALIVCRLLHAAGKKTSCGGTWTGSVHRPTEQVCPQNLF